MPRQSNSTTDFAVLDLAKIYYEQYHPRLFYKPLKDRVRIYCTSCGKYEYISKDRFKQIQKSHVCPGCWQEVKIRKHTSEECFRDCFYKGDTGYYIFYNFKFGSKPVIKAYEVIHYNKTQNVEVRYVKKGMFTSNFYWCDCNKDWRIRKGVADKYRCYSINLEHVTERKSITKHQYYLEILDELNYPERLVKSTQRKMMELYPLSKIQLMFMLAFDINNIEDLYRNNGYINSQVKSENYRTMNNLETMYKCSQLNIHYLDYLRKNKINFNNYCNYINQCKELKFKLDKPKDFEHRHQVLSEMIDVKRSEGLQDKISSRYKKLKKKSYKNGSISIDPFKTNQEIIRCGKVLHNCIAGEYMKKYASGKTNLYHLDVDGKITIAIEEFKGKLIQTYGDKNTQCPKDLKRHINIWMKSQVRKEA